MHIFNMNRSPRTVVQVENEFDKVRNEYIRKLTKLRRKYANQFVRLSSEYSKSILLGK
jgi:hypothetical protein